jgi:hypothetical protein
MRGDGLLLRIMATAMGQVNITLLLTLKNAMVAANAWSSVRGLLWNW